MSSLSEIDKLIKSENIQANILKRYMANQATKLATKLHKLYPNEFTELNLNHELRILNTYLDKCRVVISTDKAVAKLNEKTNTNPHKYKPAAIPDDNIRCCARVWDIKCIKTVNNKTGKYINYGRQCTRTRDGENDYCKMHLKKNSHGDYREADVPEYLREHFEKAFKKYGDSCLARV